MWPAKGKLQMRSAFTNVTLDLGLIALIAFWAGVVYLWVIDGPKVPVVFIALWLAGFLAVAFLGLNVSFFIAFEAFAEQYCF